MQITAEKVRAAIASSVPNFNVKALALDQNFYDDGLDSLDHASILLALQEEVGLNVPDEDVDKCVSINEILEYAAAQGGA